MPACVACGKETKLLVNGEPVCVECDDAREQPKKPEGGDAPVDPAVVNALVAVEARSTGSALFFKSQLVIARLRGCTMVEAAAVLRSLQERGMIEVQLVSVGGAAADCDAPPALVRWRRVNA